MSEAINWLRKIEEHVYAEIVLWTISHRHKIRTSKQDKTNGFRSVSYYGKMSQ